MKKRLTKSGYNKEIAIKNGVANLTTKESASQEQEVGVPLIKPAAFERGLLVLEFKGEGLEGANVSFRLQLPPAAKSVLFWGYIEYINAVTMRNLYRPLCLMALLAVAPTMLIGCSGGSSSNNSSSNTTGTNITYTSLDGQPFLEPLNLRGVYDFKPTDSGLIDFSKGNGVYSYRYTLPQPEAPQQLSNLSILNTSTETRLLYVVRPSATGQDGPVGTVYTYDSNSNSGLSVILFRQFKSSPFGEDYEITSGSATVTEIKGDNVTLQLNNVVLHAITDVQGPTDIRVNGSVTYNRKNIKTLANNNTLDAIKKSLKK